MEMLSNKEIKKIVRDRCNCQVSNEVIEECVNRTVKLIYDSINYENYIREDADLPTIKRVSREFVRNLFIKLSQQTINSTEPISYYDDVGNTSAKATTTLSKQNMEVI